VPSISLLSQSLREWTAQSELDLRAFAVCSDTKVGKLRNAEDFNVYDVPIPVTTDPAKLLGEMSHRRRAKGLTVVFSTYQSLPTVADAQALGLEEFDLVICDEAHRTTGVILADGDESNFVRVHDNDYLHAGLRLYMTATRRIYSDSVKDKADQHSAELVSMDDELRYGPEFHNLSFGDAVEHGLLTDYKVLVLTVDESVIAAPMQQQLATLGELPLDDASKIVGCWNGLAKRAGATVDGTPSFASGEASMQRAVAFARDIKASKQIAELFPRVVEAYQSSLEVQENEGHRVDDTNRDLTCEVHHVDGTFNALQRNAELAWLKSPVTEDECRILTNARCLSEGVDVPALNAVLFLHPRNSIVDVVQSVGRVMRLSPDKDYGYVILPVAVPAGIEPSEALADNVRFKVVWQVLNALRSHDERFDAMINSIALNTGGNAKTGEGTNRLLGAHIGPTIDDPPDTDTTLVAGPAQMALFSLTQWQEAVYTRIVDKVGTRVYWDQWAADVANIATAQITRINAILDAPDTDPTITEQFDRFLKGLRDNLNDSITRADAISMLSQHLITKPVFDALFTGHEFASHNPVSQVMQAMADALDASGLAAETTRLDKFYASVQARAEQVVSAEGKQQLIADLYEKFFRIGFKKQAEALGIVYTPTQVVDFILRSTDEVMRKHFGRGLTDEGVHILDGFAGTGTFITRLLQSNLITPTDLSRKYSEELHANEIMLLAYYVAAVNIEATYHALAGKNADTDDYEAFPGIALADTFQISEAGDTLDAIIFPQNNSRILRQLDTPISVIIGNPPYSVGRTSANDDIANVKYASLDRKIEQTYGARSSATNQRTLYDSYIRALRWATDRLGDAGVVGYVCNGAWIEGNSHDGLRLSLADELSTIYVYNLRGNQRTSGDLSRREGGKIFGSGSRSTVAIVIAVKDPKQSGPCNILYRDIGDYLNREEKLHIVDTCELATLAWKSIQPNGHGDWLNPRDANYECYPSIGGRKQTPQPHVFASYSSGLTTARDAWVYNSSRQRLCLDVQRMITAYNSASTSPGDSAESDPKLISWSRGLRNARRRGYTIDFDPACIFTSVYRPFFKQHIYFDRLLNEYVYQLPSLFPTPHHSNIGFYVVGTGSDKPFSCLMTKWMTDISFWGSGSGQYFARWTYENTEQSDGEIAFDIAGSADIDEYGFRRVDNITDAILELYRAACGDQLTKDDIFYYVYGLLHHPEYRAKYASDLKKVLPRIPTPETAEQFNKLAETGRKLADVHVDYESVDPHPLEVRLRPGADPADRETWRVEKMRWKSKSDHSAIVYNANVTISGIPEDAERYMLGSRSAVGWIIERYQVKTDPASGIVNDPNDWCDEHDDPTYIVELIKKITTVSVETMKLVDQLGAAEQSKLSVSV
jgi:predicted helicase